MLKHFLKTKIKSYGNEAKYVQDKKKFQRWALITLV